MRLLLDTCVALWFFEGSRRIPGSVRDRLTDPVHEVYVSAVSVLEVMIKHQLGKLPIKGNPEHTLRSLIQAHGLDVISLNADDLFELSHLPLLHRDPFDRLLIAQARKRRLTLVTPDAHIAAYDVPMLWS